MKQRRRGFNDADDGRDDGPSDGRPPGACAAHSCPLRGTMDMGGAGKFFCHGHAATPDPRDWPSLTSKLRELQWLADFHAEIARLHQRGEPWADLARTFWASEPEMLPTRWEVESGEVYLYRLLGELWWRAGVRGERPAPRHEPKYPEKRSNNLPLRSRAALHNPETV